jgi:hypothetical protein
MTLAAGLDMFLQFASDVGAIPQDQREPIYYRAQALIEAGVVAQNAEQHSENTVTLFMNAISEVLAAGRAHVATRFGGEPYYPTMCGWRGQEYFTSTADRDYDDKTVTTTSEKKVSYKPCGDCIGWVDFDSDDLWLLPGPAVAAAARLLREQENRELGLTKRTIGARLSDAKVLKSTNGKENTKSVKVGGGTQHTFHFAAGVLLRVG